VHNSKLSRNFKLNQNLTRITGTLHEDQCTFMITSRYSLLRVENVSDKVVQKIKTQILNWFFFSKIVSSMR